MKGKSISLDKGTLITITLIIILGLIFIFAALSVVRREKNNEPDDKEHFSCNNENEFFSQYMERHK